MKKFLPLVPGHEAVGIIEEIGPRAAARWGVAVGDRVGVAPRQACGACPTCLSGDPRGCERHRGDTYGSISVHTAPSLWGGYGEYQYLSPDSQIVRIPGDLDPVVAAMFNAVANGIRWGAVVPKTKPGDVAAVLGPGIRGLSAAVAARDAGAKFVMLTGRGERDRATAGSGPTIRYRPRGRRRGRRSGRGSGRARWFARRRRRRRHGNGAHAAFVQALDLACDRGTVCVAGIHGDGDVPGFRPDVIVLKELRIVGARGTDIAEFNAAVALLASGRYPFATVPARTAGLEEMSELLAVLAGERDEPAPPFVALRL